MDPVNVFKQKSDLWYLGVKDKFNNLLNGDCSSENITLFLDMKNKFSDNDNKINISDDLIKYSDQIYYSNGVYDKLYFDSTLIYPTLVVPDLVHHNFNFYNFTFDKPDNYFYFKDGISFSGSIWNNLKEF